MTAPIGRDRLAATVIPTLFLRAMAAPDADRPEVLEAFLRDRGVVPTRTVLAGSLHLAVRFPDAAYDARYRTKLLVAHHDRRPGSPGALDNGAACLQLADLAGRLAARSEPHNTAILFTDSEESSGAADQGSYSVARALAGRVRALAGEGEEPPAVFVFDVTGCGTAPVLSTSARDLLVSRGMEGGGLAAQIRDLDSWAGRALRRASGSAPARLPVPWSDELGFALGGVPAVTVTLLPRAELESYRASLLSSRKAESGSRTRHGEYPEGMPDTWARLHGPDDSLEALEEESFDLMSRVLDAFGELKIPRVRRIR